MVEAIANAGKELGLPADVALGLARQTCFGAGHMLVDTGEDPAELRRKVTSPNGTTHAAIESFKASGLEKACYNAVLAATKRGEELGKEMGRQVSTDAPPPFECELSLTMIPSSSA